MLKCDSYAHLNGAPIPVRQVPSSLPVQVDTFQPAPSTPDLSRQVMAAASAIESEICGLEAILGKYPDAATIIEIANYDIQCVLGDVATAIRATP